jgi:transposase
MNNQIKRASPKFTLEFKQDAAKLVNEKGYAHQQAADNLGIPLSAIGRWSRAERGSASPSGNKTATLSLIGQAELLRLRKENEQLRMEREIIKKARASKPRKSNEVRGYGVPLRYS